MARKVNELTRAEVRDILEQVPTLVKLADELDDENFERAMVYVVKLLQKPDIDIASAQFAIVHLEALATEFSMEAVYYKTFGKGGPDERNTKDVYYSARDAIRHLVDSLKYIIRAAERA